jgi:hypothetical protein
MWSSLCFVGLAINNVLLFVDLVFLPNVDLSVVRSITALIALVLLQLRNGANESQSVGDHLWQLHRKLEIVGNRRGPPLVSSSSMRAVKARIDFYTVEQRRVPLQVGSKRREAV